jgi:glycosyltransferase involved in cell wall biosynthesis
VFFPSRDLKAEGEYAAQDSRKSDYTLSDLPPPPPGSTGWPWTEASPCDLLSTEWKQGWPSFTVITPSYNQGKFIEETIRSVLLQGYPALEYLIIDGGSTDGTVEILKRYGTWLKWISESDSGQAEAINKGLRMASGDVLSYLNSDDLYLPGGIAAVATFLQNHAEAGLVYNQCKVIDEFGEEIGSLPKRPFSLRRTIERAESLPQQAVFWRREATALVGLLDDRLQYAMDFEYFIRIACRFPVAYVPVQVAAFRMQRASKTVSRSEDHWREGLAVSSRYGLKSWKRWYWIRRLRHWGLRALPLPVQFKIRQRLARA